MSAMVRIHDAVKLDIKNDLHWLAGWSLAALFASLVFRAATNPAWDPRDEIAHFDYVVTLSSGGTPQVGDLIKPLTFEMTQDLSWLPPKSYSGTRRSMGLAGRSYEAQQPPLYYATLLPVYVLLRAMKVEPRGVVVGLRVVSLVLVAAGCLVLIELYRRLGRICDISVGVGWLCAAVAMSLLGPHALSIGNDAGSFLCGSLAVLMAVHYLIDWRQLWLFAASLVVVAGIWVKVSNVGLVAIPVACVIWGWRRRKVSAMAWVGLLPLAFAPAWELYNLMRHDGMMPSATVADQFARFVEPLHSWLDVIQSLLLSLGLGLAQTALATKALVSIVCLSMFINVSACLIWWRRRSARQGLPALFGGAGVLVTIAAALLLNEYIEGVHWHAFRHYMGFGAFWVSAIAAFPVRSGSHGERRVLWVAVMFALFAAAWNFFGPTV